MNHATTTRFASAFKYKTLSNVTRDYPQAVKIVRNPDGWTVFNCKVAHDRWLEDNLRRPSLRAFDLGH